eukprot:NODE_7997_length_720_cov_145.584590_g7381_i0.p1 GENE.NODE_7997_length_720_cov_145.584590_g7381_i0~~NODE_7997_length_720_cov_145.584590_g7381_i0.p1  ORF type:complete len:171 (-),score=31.47 NODE_7997_length_720_cov_145.584590_g7381_i0:148-660(-)
MGDKNKKLEMSLEEIIDYNRTHKVETQNRNPVPKQNRRPIQLIPQNLTRQTPQFVPIPVYVPVPVAQTAAAALGLDLTNMITSQSTGQLRQTGRTHLVGHGPIQSTTIPTPQQLMTKRRAEIQLQQEIQRSQKRLASINESRALGSDRQLTLKSGMTLSDRFGILSTSTR